MEFLPQLIVSVVVILVIMHVMLIAGPAYGILLERKIASWAQDRIGPNRVGPFGLLQPIADGLKFFMKEDYNPGHVDKTLFMLAPVLAVIPALLGWAVIPWGGVWESPWGELSISVADVNIGVIYMLAIGSMAVYGVTIGAWAANNKYTFFGGIRATAQMLSYEIPMGLCVLTVLLMAGSARPHDLVEAQVGYWFGVIPSWYVFQQPVAAVLFFICILAEANRAPFDLAECEQELIGGFHTEYSSMKFAMFFLGEYMHMATSSAFLTVLFLGGWHLPWLDYLIYGGVEPQKVGLLGVLLNVGVMVTKMMTLVAIMMWVRWTLPRFRFDQLMRLAWRGLIPIGLALLLTTGVFVYFGLQNWLWLGNIAIAAVVLFVAPLIPKGADVNRRVPLAGSRFSPLTSE
ncbi:MAG: NADH-quinone oxidoreductase subunit NuoH [Planctomycetes bacterium]|nr:NADH-quinone oxidoreductase subunit NuoH [Planctomycetota bacterium]